MRLERAPMEPGQTSEAPRPRGFVRRNCFWLAVFLGFLLLSVLEGRLDLILGSSSLTIELDRGGLYVNPRYSTCPMTESSFELEFQRPSFGTSPRVIYYDAPGDWSLRVPIWLPLVVLFLWIAFREWRRKRRHVS
jgi:hypothetical protein